MEYDENLMNILLKMGFPKEAIKRALFYTFNQSLDYATQWLMDHITDDNYAEPFFPSGPEFNNGENDINFYHKLHIIILMVN